MTTLKRNNNEWYNINLHQIPKYLFISVFKTITPGDSDPSIPKEDDSVIYMGILPGLQTHFFGGRFKGRIKIPN